MFFKLVYSFMNFESSFTFSMGKIIGDGVIINAMKVDQTNGVRRHITKPNHGRCSHGRN